MTTRGDDTAGSVPAWAAPFAPEEWAWFVAILAEDLDRRGITHRIDMDTGCVHASTTGPNVLGLSNLLQLCRSRPREEWRRRAVPGRGSPRANEEKEGKET